MFFTPKILKKQLVDFGVMVSIEVVLQRINHGWDVILGETFYKSIDSTLRLDSDYVGVWASSALKMYGPELLRNARKRAILIRNLTADEQNELASLIGIQPSNHMVKDLVELRISKNSSNERILFNFFDMVVPLEEKGEEVSDSESVEGGGYQLYRYQKDVLTQAMDVYHSDKRNSLMIQMPTGSGKTRVAMNMIARILMESPTAVLWIAYSEELCEQAIQEFKQAWGTVGDRSVEVCRYFEKHSAYDTEDGLIVAGLSKLWKGHMSNDYLLHDIAVKTSLIVFDEAHQAIASTYMMMIKTLMLYNENITLIGLSATPGRSSYESTSELVDLFQSNIVKISMDGYNSPIDYLYEKGYLSKPLFTQLVSKADVLEGEEGVDYSASILKEIGNNAKRNGKIVDAILNAILLKGHKKVLVFAASVESAKYLTFRVGEHISRTYIVTAETDSSLRKKYINEFKEVTDEPMVMCNYGVLTTGVDVPSIDCVVIARPTTSLVLYSQMVGRALRGPAMGGTESAEIITVADIDLKGYGSVIEAYKNWDEDWKYDG